MILPNRWFGLITLKSTSAIDYSSVTVSPAEAIQNLNAKEGKSLDVTGVVLTSVNSVPVYQVFLRDGSSHLINAFTGHIFTITSDLAERIIRDNVSTNGRPVKVVNLVTHDILYPIGPLPVYRITIDGDSSNIFYVSVQNGVITQSNQLTRIRALISSLHTFEPVKLLSQRDSVRKGLLLLVSLVGIATALTGYYLAILPYFRKMTRRRKISATADLSHTDCPVNC
jgi:hypothetical protein